MISDETPAIDKFTQEIDRLKMAALLLEQVHILGLTDEIRYKINAFFDFDDSE
jgi:hypothetical protein